MFPKDIFVRVYRYPADLPIELARAILNLILPVPGYLLVATTEPRHPGDECWYRIPNDDIRAGLWHRFREGAAQYNRYLPMGQMTLILVDCCEAYTPKENTP